MTIDQANVLEVAINQAYGRLIHECLAFQAAQIYLLKINLLALEGLAPVKISHDAFSETLLPYYESPYEFFVARSFISLVASFELFLQDVATAIVIANPKKVGNVEFKLAEILDASGTDELVRRGIESSLNKLMYKKPSEYLYELSILLSIDQTPLIPKWPIFVEAKARRDLGVHNGWRCNTVYLRKVSEIGVEPALIEGDSAFPVSDKYLHAVGFAFAELGTLISSGMYRKHLKKELPIDDLALPT